MMSDVTNILVEHWLDSAIPPALKDIHQFQEVVERAQAFCLFLGKQGYTCFDALQAWANNAPTVWLAKCRETSLESIRKKLSNGKNIPQQLLRLRTFEIHPVSHANNLI
jgi:centromere/kinetochore protein ZW10